MPSEAQTRRALNELPPEIEEGKKALLVVNSVLAFVGMARVSQDQSIFTGKKGRLWDAERGTDTQSHERVTSWSTRRGGSW